LTEFDSSSAVMPNATIIIMMPLLLGGWSRHD